MKSDDIKISNILEIKTTNPSSSPRDLVINTTSEGRTSSPTDSNGSSPSDLRRRLEDLPSPNEFTPLTDRVAALGRRICRKREAFLRLHGAANRIEEDDEWEEREQRAESESSLGSSRPKDARARRRARVRPESSPRRDDKAMVISQAGGSTGPSKITGDDDKLNPAEFLVARSAWDDCLRLPAIAIPRGQTRPSSALSEPSSARFPSHSNGESRDTKCKTVSHSYRNPTPRDSASKSADLPLVSPFSLSSIRPKKFGGYRPPSGIIPKHLSSGSEPESVNETSRGLSSARKIGNAIATLELSSPESCKAVSSVDEPIKKMPILSARNDIIGTILPNLLPSSRSLDDNDDLDHRIARNTPRSCTGQITSRDRTETCNQPREINTLVKAIFNERASHDGFVAQTSSEFRQVEPEYEDTRYQRRETPRDTSIFFAKSFMSESAELVTSTYNEQVTHNKSTMKAYKRLGSEFEGTQEVEDYRRVESKAHHNDIKDQFEFNCPTSRSNSQVDSSENNGDVLDVAEWNRSTSLYTKEAVDTSRLIEGIQNDVTEEALSSRTSELYGSEDHSRSSCAAKIYLQKETLSSGRPQNGIDTPDKCDREIMIKVPTLALNSQDISYSTSAGSRECSATQSLDPHALIKALSDVSLKREKHGEDVSRKREVFYRNRDAIDVSSGATDFPVAKGETWRVPRFPTSESPRKSLSRVPSRIPVRISSNKSIPPGNELSECCKPENSSETANYEELKFIEQNDAPRESIVRQINSSHSRICKQSSSSKSRNESIEVTIAEGAFAPDDEAEYEINDRAFKGSLTCSNLRSTSFGDYPCDKTRHLPESKFKGESCPSMFSHRAAYVSGRDYAKTDDDVRSRSDRSTSRRSVDTMDITSATESPGLSKYKKNESSRVESLRHVEESVTWRTEDECASINDEENLEDLKDKDYMTSDKTPEESYLRENERYKLAIERMRDTLPLRTQHLQPDSPSNTQKGGRKRDHAGDDLEFNDEVRRAQELSNFAARISSSALNLNCDPKRKRMSQERFPFTISEASGAPSAEHEATSDYRRLSPGENLSRTKMDDRPREKTVYQLKMHSSITRLATAGVEDTVTDILCCVAQEKKATSSKSKIKALVRIFSSKLKKAPRQESDDKRTLGPAKIIYENNACQADSKANSCSGDSLIEAHKTCSDNRWGDRHATRSNPTLVSSWETLKKTESLQAIARKHPRRRYDRDDLWVRDIKDSAIDEKKNSEISQGKDEADGKGLSRESPPTDRYSIFLAKYLPSDKPSISDRDNSPKDVISGHVRRSSEGKRSSDREVPLNFMPEVEEVEEDLTGCLCWRLCRIIAPSKYRSPIKARVPASSTRRSDSLQQKRKK